MDSISVPNRMPKHNQSKSPYESLTGKQLDLLRDFCVEWGVLMAGKSPKGVSSDLDVTDQWAGVVNRIMDGTRVLKVYLIQGQRFAYRLKFFYANAPEWALEMLKDENLETNIGFEDLMEVEKHRIQERIFETEQREIK